MNGIDKIKKIFIDETDDEETRLDNQRKIDEWTSLISKSELVLSWQEHDYTKKLIDVLKTEYKYFGLKLATERDLTEDQRKSIYNKQDACLLIIEIMTPDFNPKETLKEVNKEIQIAIDAT